MGAREYTCHPVQCAERRYQGPMSCGLAYITRGRQIQNMSKALRLMSNFYRVKYLLELSNGTMLTNHNLRNWDFQKRKWNQESRETNLK